MHNRGNVLARLGQHSLALSDFAAAIQANPRAAESFASRAQSLFQLGRRDEALADYVQAFEISALQEHGLALADAHRRCGALQASLRLFGELEA